MKHVIAVLAGALALSGCATGQRAHFLGKPVEVAIAQFGPPDSVTDMADGRREFQWRKQRKEVETNQVTMQVCRYTIRASQTEPAGPWIMERGWPARTCP